MQEKLRGLYLKQDKLPSFLEEDEGAQLIENSYINLAVIDLKAQQEREAKLLSNPNNTEANEIDSPEDSMDETDTIEIKSLFNQNNKDSKVKEKVGSSDDAEEEIEEEQESGKPRNHQRILIHGKAGIGKTTLMKYITYNWAKGKLWNEFDYVFLLPLRKLSNYQKKSAYDGLEGFIYECCLSDGRITNNIEGSIERIKKALDKTKVLLLLDGYDELNPKKDNRDFVMSILNAVFNHQKLSVIMTSRPNMVETAYKQKFDCQLVNVGFSDANIISYIEKNFGDDEEAKQNLLRLIEENTTVRGMCHTPINLHLLCLVWLDLVNEKQGKIESQEFSTTSLYVGIVDWLIRRYVKKTQDINVEDIKNLKHGQIERDYEWILKIHEKIAYEGFKQGKAVLEKGTLSKQGVDYYSYRAIQKIGLLKAIETDEGTKSNTQGIINQEHYYMHLTLLEYMVARFTVRALNSDNDEQVKEAIGFLEDKKYVQRYERMLCFIAGIVSLNKDQSIQPSQALLYFWNVMINGRADLGVIKQLNLIIKCIGESGIDVRIPDINNIKSYLKDTIASIAEARGKRAIGKIPERIEEWLGIARTIEEIANEQEIRKLIAKLESGNEEEKLETIKRIEKVDIEEVDRMIQKQIVEALLKLFESSRDEMYNKIKVILNELTTKIKDEGLRAQINKILIREKIKEDEIIEQIKESMIKNNSSQVGIDDKDNIGIKDCIERIRDKEAIIVALVPLLQDQNKDIRNKTAEALGKLNITNYQLQAQIVNAFVPLLKDEESMIRISAAEVLGKITDLQLQAKIVPALISLLESENSHDFGVAEALSKINIIDPQLQARIVAALVPLLEDKRDYVQLRAAKILDKIKINITDPQLQARIVAALVPLLASRDEWICSSALEALVKLGTAPQVQTQMIYALIPLLKNQDWYVRNKVAKAFGRLNITNPQIQTKIVTALVPLLKDEESLIRISVVGALGKLNIIDPQLQVKKVEILMALLQDSNLYIRIRVVEDLVMLNITDHEMQAQMVKVLVSLLQDEDVKVCKNATEVLNKITDLQLQAQIVTALVPLLQDEDEGVRYNAAKLLGKLNTIDPQVQAQMVTTLLLLLKDKNEWIRYSAVEVFGKLNIIDSQLQVKVVEALAPLLEDEDKHVRTTTAETLSKLNVTDPQVQGQIVATLVLLLKDDDRHVRNKAVETMGKLNIIDSQLQVKVVEALAPLLEDKDKHVRTTTAETLSKLNVTDPQVQGQIVATLVLLLKDDNRHVRNKAVETMGKLNIIDSQLQVKVVEALAPLLEDKDKHVFIRVAGALGKLTKDPQLEAQMVTALAPLLEDNITDIQTQARMITALAPLLKSKDRDVRVSAAKALNKLNITDIQIQVQEIMKLVCLLNDNDEYIRSKAARALRELNIIDAEMQRKTLIILMPLLQDSRHWVRSSAAESLSKLNITDVQIQAQIVDVLIALFQDSNFYILNRAVVTFGKLTIINVSIKSKMIDTLVPLLQSQERQVSNYATLILTKLNIIDLTLQTKLLDKLSSILKNKDIRILSNAIKVLDSLVVIDELQNKLLDLMNKLILISTTVDKDIENNKELEITKLRIAYILNKLSIKDPIILREIINSLIQTAIVDKFSLNNLSTYAIPLLNSFLEKVLIQNVPIALSADLLRLFSLPLFKQAAVVVKEESVVINYRGYQREMLFAEDESDMAYQVFAYFYQQHQQSGIATRLLDYRLNYSKALNITGLKTEYGALTIPKSTLQQHTYSLVNQAIRVTCKDWLVSIIRKDRSVGNAQHTFLLFEGRNIHYGAELCRAELVQPNPKQNEGRIIVDEYLDIKCSELSRMFQNVLGNSRYDGASNPFKANEHYYAKSCLVTREIAKAMIGKAKEAALVSGGIKYDYHGTKYDNCLTWTRKILKAHLSEEEYAGLEIEKKESFADPLAYLGPTTAMNVRAAHYVKDGVGKIGKIIHRGK